MRLADLQDFFWKLMEPAAGTVLADNVVVAQPIQIAAVEIRWMYHDVHVLCDIPRLVVADQRTFDQIVTLAVTVEPRSSGRPFLRMKPLNCSQMSLLGVPGLSSSRVNMRASLTKPSSSFICCGTLAPTTQMRPSSAYMPPGPGAPHEERHCVALLYDAILHMPLAITCGTAKRHRGQR